MSINVFIMKSLHLNLKYLTFLFMKSRAPAAAAPPLARRDSRTVLHFIRTMATNNINNNSNSDDNPGNSQLGKKARQKDPLRRVKTKERRSRRGDGDGPTTVYVQVVGAGTRGNAPSLFIFSEQNRYLFNCGEGTQRLMQEHKLKFTHLDAIFLTQLKWQKVGGLSGLLLTLKDIGVPECVLCGPPQLTNYVNAIESFSGLENIELLIRPYTETYSDSTLTVHQVPIFAQSGHHSMTSSPRSSSPSLRPGSPKTGNVRGGQPYSPEPAKDPSLVIAFICKVQPKRGSFLVPQALDLGLPVGTAAIGPLVAALKSGNSIVFEGREIRPEQVCAPASPGQVFLIVDCPSEDFVDAVCTNQNLRRCQTEDPAALVVHMTPESVLKTDSYKEWMERFPSTTQHLVLNEQANAVHHHRSHKVQAQLNMIHPDIFPQLKLYKTEEPQAALNVPIVRAECLLKFRLRPVMEWQRDAVLSCNTEEFVNEAAEVPNFLEEVEKCRKICSSDAAELSGQQDEHPEVVFLGTGSALPMKIRNVSSTLVNISPSQSLLLDCGEGTFSQLCNHYGNDVDDVLCKISTIFVSHMHADHHTGLLNLLYQRARAMTTLGKTFSPIYLIAPGQIMKWLKQYHNTCEDILNHITIIPNTSDSAPLNPWTDSLIKAMLEKNDLKQFQTCLVRHCKNAFACSFTHQSGWKMAFSGDTMPCEEFVRIGKDASLLIHEATLEDGLEEEAVKKRHSTTSQAIKVGMRMNAKFIMLNHFSQRYAKIPLFNEDFNDRVGISFDHMRINYRDLKILPRLIPALKTLFAVAIEEMEEKREKRELKYLKGRSFERDNEQGLEAVIGRGSKRDQEAATHNIQTKRQKTSFANVKQ